jgi:hypothetical protein
MTAHRALNILTAVVYIGAIAVVLLDVFVWRP